MKIIIMHFRFAYYLCLYLLVGKSRHWINIDDNQHAFTNYETFNVTNLPTIYSELRKSHSCIDFLFSDDPIGRF
jgi:hypothetical protein